MAKEALPAAPFLAVGAAPHFHCGTSIQGMMRNILIALAPAVVGALYWYGMEAARVMALSVSTAIVVEVLATRLMNREVMVDDLHAVVYGLLFAFIVPAGAPWWLVVAGSTVTMLMGKMLFGELGGSPVAGPAVGWAFCSVSWPIFMDPDAVLLNTEMINPLTQLKYFGVDKVADFGIPALLSGAQLGALGAAQVGALLIGGIYLIVRGTIRWQAPVGFIVGVLGLGSVYYFIDPTVYASPLFHLFTGSTVLAAFFLMTDTNSSPVGCVSRLVYGIIGGVLVILIRTYGQYPDGVMFAVLLSNMVSPLVDLIKPKPFGAR
ncbi:RnfABCDGE type electron transport complex subunit D [Desulfovibrio psychrotolerans]|uniref:Electron transport complex subunit D n=1 Tax=Desulfovibrio psychrotolerans TaxID=415242 RepID=A0A7J0BTI0_9BACT|nr:RnfABCDGE type electron transport complex subunit D [Desulfovibrio psychrotolerans]GFM36304.1 electron transport complex subunit D [Desulfovibrio psychrotolerans]